MTLPDRVEVQAPWQGHRGRVIRVVMTLQQCLPLRVFPVKTCVVCEQSYPFLDFIGEGSLQGEYWVVMDRVVCYRCAEIPAMPLWRDGHDRLRMRFRFRQANGDALKMEDETTGRYVDFGDMGVRLMNGPEIHRADPELRMQPYSGRNGQPKFGRGGGGMFLF